MNFFGNVAGIMFIKKNDFFKKISFYSFRYFDCLNKKYFFKKSLTQ
jgi:hypothetical protein